MVEVCDTRRCYVGVDIDQELLLEGGKKRARKSFTGGRGAEWELTGARLELTYTCRKPPTLSWKEAQFTYHDRPWLCDVEDVDFDVENSDDVENSVRGLMVAALTISNKKKTEDVEDESSNKKTDGV